MIGKKVRLNTKTISWYTTTEAYEMYTVRGELLDDRYDLTMENILLMIMFKDEYPAIITELANTGNYRIKFHNGYSCYSEPKNLIYE